MTAPKYARMYGRRCRRRASPPTTWDVDAQGVPHHLGVLDHFKAVVWYLGDNRLTHGPQDEVTETPFGPLPDTAWPSASST